jgi:hypothetical protein
VLGATLAALAVGAGWVALARIAALPQEQREQIVELVRSGQITEKDEFGRLILPERFADATVHGEVTVFEDPFTVFFLTETFFGPDPYCGYEYTEGSEPRVDPHGSGRNTELKPLGGEWWWLCAR